MNTAILLAAIALCLIPAAAYGHGQGLDTIKSIGADGATVNVTVEISDYLVESQERRVTITVTDAALQERVEDARLLLRLFHQDMMILEQTVRAPGGILQFDMLHADTDAAAPLTGSTDPESGDWVAFEDVPLAVGGPTLGSGGLYSFEIGVIAAGGPESVPPDIYNADVSVVEESIHAQEDLDGAEALFQTRSYFDTVSDFEYDPQAGTATFEMPFDWSERTISHVPVVHVEVHFPKEFAEFLHPSYTGKVNGIDLFKTLVTVDDYTGVEDRIVHFVLLNDHIKFLKNQQRQAGLDIPDTMVFELAASDEMRFPMTAYTRDEQFQVDLSWSPVEIRPDETTTFVFTIRDGAAGEPLRQSSYVFVLLQNGAELYRNSGTAVVGGSFETYTFSEDQGGPVIIRFEDIDGTGAITEFGVVVVPEFGAAVLALLAGTAAAVLGPRFRGSPLLKQ